MGQKTECEIQKELVSNLLSTGATNKGLKKFKELLNGDFLLFANKENALANEAEMILKLQEIEKELEIISAYPLLHTKNVVAVGGGFSAGKSEFISSFIQSDVKLPIGVVPTTAIPTYVFHEEKRNFLGCSSKGGIVDLEKIDEDFQSKLSHDFIKSFDFNLKDIMPYLLIASPLSHDHICFVDTPGYNPATISDGFTSEDVKTAKDFLENANALLWLIGGDSNGTIGNTDLQFLENLNLEDKKLYVVFNKADLKPLDDLEDILEEIAESLEDADIDVEGISAYSSIMQEEYTHKGKTLEEFLQNCNNFISKHQELLQRVYSVYEAYRVATQNKIDEKKNAKEELHSLSLDIFEEGIDLDKPVHERVTKIQEYFSTEQEEENLKTLKSVFEEFKNSINDVFGIVKEYMDNETKTQDPVQEEVNEDVANKESSKKSDKIYPLKKENLYGFIDTDGQWVVEPQYEEIEKFDSNDLIKVKKDGKYGFINTKGEIVIEPQFDEIEAFEDELSKVKQNDKYGFINTKGEIIIQPQFKHASSFSEGFAEIGKNEKYGLIDKKGNIIIEPQFDDIYGFENGFAKFEINDRIGLINTAGKIIINPEYDNKIKVKNGFIEVKHSNKKGLFNKQGQMILDFNYDSIAVNDNFFIVQKYGRYEFLDKNTQLIRDDRYEDYDIMGNGYIAVKHYGKWGLLNKNFEMIVEPKYDEMYKRDENFITVELDNKEGIMNSNGEIVLDPIFYTIYEFLNGFARTRYRKRDKWGFINQNYEVTAEPIFKHANDFTENGLAKVETSDGKYCFINTDGKVVIESKFDDVYDFKEGFAKIKQGAKYGFIDESGKVVIEAKYDELKDFSEDYAVAKMNNKVGFIDKTGMWKIDPIYEDAESFENGFARVKSQGEWGIANKDGIYLGSASKKIKEEKKTSFPFFGSSSFFDTDKKEDSKFIISKNNDIIINKTGKVGVKKYNGEWLVLPHFDKIEFLEDLIKVKFGDNEGYISYDGEYLTFSEEDIYN
ncbi:WG repeat-containing protein [Sulfurimonas sp. NW15]|uniref:WG repeat-containing protein n=1 Tax=Sulfurimonas sp. NW15 TaxID=2922729 RepID=UPI003DA7BD1C